MDYLTLDQVLIGLKKEYDKTSNKRKTNVSLPLVHKFYDEVKKLLIYDFLFEKRCDEELNNLLVQSKVDFSLLCYQSEVKERDKKTAQFISSLVDIRKSLLTSVETIYNNDPASDSYQEVVLSYPGFEAILSYRVAHLVYSLGLTYTARLLSEMSHSKTGIDINPGAIIGDYFFIDHGTGIVIGQTCIIGKNVKIYQGVTLGALSLSKGKALQGLKRHPTIEDNVTIYSSAAIMGGKTIIGHDSTIGSVCYITSSIEPYSLVYMSKDGLTIKKKN